MALFLVFDGVTKIIKVKPVVEACQKMKISPEMAVGAGLLLLACTTLHVMPRTAMLAGDSVDRLSRRLVATQWIDRSAIFLMNIGKVLFHRVRPHLEPLVRKPTAQGTA